MSEEREFILRVWDGGCPYFDDPVIDWRRVGDSYESFKVAPERSFIIERMARPGAFAIDASIDWIPEHLTPVMDTDDWARAVIPYLRLKVRKNERMEQRRLRDALREIGERLYGRKRRRGRAA